MDTKALEPPYGNGQRGIDICNSNYAWLAFRRCTNVLVHSLIVVCVFVTIWFAFKSSLNAFHLHIILCVIGYQLLMSNGILCLDDCNGWSVSFKFVHRRRMHWILQAIGSLLAIVGSIVMIQQKTSNFNSTHGKVALAALIMTCFSCLNGVASLYKTTFQRILPFETLKTSHLFCGTTAFIASSICLCFGFVKDSFNQWSSEQTQYAMIGIVSVYTGIIACKLYWKIWRKLAKAKKIKKF